MNRKDLHIAVSSGDLVRTREILRRDSSCINDWNIDFKTPLHLVYDCVDQFDPVQADDKLSMIELLIDYGADLNSQNFNSESILHFAVRQQQVNGIKLLLENKIDPNIRNKFDSTALWSAICMDHEHIVELLLNYKADPNMDDFSADTPLHFAISFLKCNSAKKLIQYGYKIFKQRSAKSNNIYESLLEACNNSWDRWDQSHQQLLKQFIKFILKRADAIDIHGKFTLKALRYHLISQGHKESHRRPKKCLLSAILDQRGIFTTDEIGDSDLHLAVRHMNEEAVKNLLQKGADTSVKNFFDETPLHLILKKERLSNVEVCDQIASLLIKNGADLRAQNYVGETPFFLAVKRNIIKILHLMLAKIAGVDEMTLSLNVRYLPGLHFRNNNNSLHLNELIVASSFGCEQVVNYTLDIDHVDMTRKNCCRDINSALYAAVNSHQHYIIRMLLEAGLKANSQYPSIIPRFSIDKYCENDLRTVCLFWEFTDVVTINQAILDAFRHTIRYPENDNKFQNLLVFFYAIYVRLKKFNKKFIPAQGLFKLNTELAAILLDCNKKLDEWKKIKAGKISVFDIITISLDSYVKLLNRKEHLNACKKLRSLLYKKKRLKYYDYVLEIRIDLAIKKRNLLNAAENCLDEALQSVLASLDFQILPYHLKQNIFSFISMRELEKIAKTN